MPRAAPGAADAAKAALTLFDTSGAAKEKVFTDPAKDYSPVFVVQEFVTWYDSLPGNAGKSQQLEPGLRNVLVQFTCP
eukprot:gene7863-50457_t